MIVAIGMDPGETVGLCRLTYASDQSLIMTDVVQASASTALDLLEVLLRVPTGTEVYFQVEKFVIGRGSYRSGSPGARTRDMVGSAITMVSSAGRSGSVSKEATGTWVSQRSANETKAWATDGRLDAAGLFDPTKGMGHARDAARHALFTAVAEGNIPDPLSRKAKRANG
jgi:hypothetical protein